MAGHQTQIPNQQRHPVFSPKRSWWFWKHQIALELAADLWNVAVYQHFFRLDEGVWYLVVYNYDSLKQTSFLKLMNCEVILNGKSNPEIQKIRPKSSPLVAFFFLPLFILLIHLSLFEVQGHQTEYMLSKFGAKVGDSNKF